MVDEMTLEKIGAASVVFAAALIGTDGNVWLALVACGIVWVLAKALETRG